MKCYLKKKSTDVTNKVNNGSCCARWLTETSNKAVINVITYTCVLLPRQDKVSAVKDKTSH